MAETEAIASLFSPGDRVRVREAYPIGHVRTPYYIRGKTGVVERLCGAYPNPEELAVILGRTDRTGPGGEVFSLEAGTILECCDRAHNVILRETDAWMIRQGPSSVRRSNEWSRARNNQV